MLVSGDGAGPRPPRRRSTSTRSAAGHERRGDSLGIDVAVQAQPRLPRRRRNAQAPTSCTARSRPRASSSCALSDGVAITRWTGHVAPATPQFGPGTAAGGRGSPTAAMRSASPRSPASRRHASSAQAPPRRRPRAVPGSFLFPRHISRSAARTRCGTGAAAFGGGRGHQGQDVFARCGTPLVAARGGRRKFKRYHSRAGNYLVIDGDGTGSTTRTCTCATPRSSTGRPRLHRPADRLRRRHRPRRRLPPALRDLDRRRAVQRRPRDRPAAVAEGLG